MPKAAARTLAVAVRFAAPALEPPRHALQPWRGLAQGAEKAEAAGSGESTGAAEGSSEERGPKDEKAASSGEGAGAAEGSNEEREPKDEKTAAATEEAAAEDKSSDKVEETEEVRLQRELAELQEKVKARKHKLLSALAEFENNKKRFANERASRQRTATKAFASKMVDVYTEFEDLVAAPLMGQASEGAASEALREGVVLTRDLYRATLEKFDLKPLQPELGEPFVAARHECTSEGEKAVAGAVTELVRPGWILESRGAAPVVVRKAQVKVAGNDAPPPPPE